MMNLFPLERLIFYFCAHFDRQNAFLVKRVIIYSVFVAHIKFVA